MAAQRPPLLRPRTALHPVATALVLLLAGAGSQMPARAQAASAAAPQAVQGWKLPAAPLADTLARIAREGGRGISADPTLLAGRQAPAVQGRFSVEEAAQRALAGSGLQLAITPSGTMTVVAAPTQAASTQEAGNMLATVTVAAQAPATPTTEGSASYTTPATMAATGFALSLRDTPQSISVVTRQQIEDQAYVTADDALTAVTGLHGAAWDTKRTYYWSRGFSVDRVSYDGVVSNDTSGGSYGDSAQDLAFYDRVEVVRGATGLLTGAGEPSATINYVRKRASSKAFRGSASLSAGSWNDLHGSLDLSTPLSGDGRVRGRLVALAQKTDSFRNYYQDDKGGLYGVVEADLTPQTRLSAGVDYQRDKPTGATWGGLPLLYTDGTRTNWSRSLNPAARWTRWSSTTKTVFTDLEHRFDNGWQLKGNLTRREVDYQSKLLYLYSDSLDRTTGTMADDAAYPWAGTASRQQTTASLQASGPFSLLGREHELIVGLNGSRRHSQDDSYDPSSGGIASVGNFHQWDGSYPEPDWNNYNYTASDPARTRENAAYAAVRLSLADPLKVIVGGRFSDWRSTANDTKRAHKRFTPYVGAVYDLGQSHSLYASYAEIFNPQDNRTATGDYLDPATGKNYEIGLKGEYLEGRLNASVALFKTLKDNVAKRDGDNRVPGTTDYAYVGAKGVKSRGIEAEISGEPLPGWNLVAGITRTVTQEPDGTAFSPHLPTTLFKLGTAYRLPGAWHRLTVGGSVRWQNDTYTDVTVTSGTYRYDQAAFAVVGLMARYDFAPRLSLQVNLNNVFDKTYWAYFETSGTYGAPRNLRATLNYRF